MKVRVGFGGGAASDADARLAFASVTDGLHVSINSVACPIDVARQIAGQLHIGGDFSFLTAIEIDVPTSALSSWHGSTQQVVVWSSGARANSSVISTVVLVVQVE
jgi:hypothetical protein